MRLVALAIAGMIVAGAAPAAAETKDPLVAPKRSFELRPCAGWAFWPDSVTRALAGADVGWRAAPQLEVALDVAIYQPFNQGVGDHASWPIGEAQFSTFFDFVWSPFPARARRGEEAGAVEPYLLGGLGLVRQRPISVIDPQNRKFDWSNKVALDAGAGMRIFTSRTLALFLEIVDLTYGDSRENPVVAPGDPSLPSDDPRSPRNPTFWYDSRFTCTPTASGETCTWGSGPPIVNAIQVRLGASFLVGGR